MTHTNKDTRSMRGMSVVDCLRKLLDMATPGPWYVHPSGSDREHVAECNRTEVRSPERVRGNGSEDAALIAALRNAAPDLLRVVEAAQRVVATDPSSNWDGLTDALDKLTGVAR